jgi:hypothetical protein
LVSYSSQEFAIRDHRQLCQLIAEKFHHKKEKLPNEANILKSGSPIFLSSLNIPIDIPWDTLHQLWCNGVGPTILEHLMSNKSKEQWKVYAKQKFDQFLTQLKPPSFVKDSPRSYLENKANWKGKI